MGVGVWSGVEGCACRVRVRKGDESRGSALKRRPAGWLCALNSDGKVTGLKAQV